MHAACEELATAIVGHCGEIERVARRLPEDDAARWLADVARMLDAIRALIPEAAPTHAEMRGPGLH